MGNNGKIEVAPARAEAPPIERTGLRSLLRGQFAPRVSLRKPLSIGVIPERAAAAHGRVPIYLDAPFQFDPDQREELDFVELSNLVRQLSGALYEAGVRPWDRVAIAKTPSFDIIALACAAARIGAVPALLSGRLDGEIMSILLERLDAPFLYMDEATAERAGLAPKRLAKLAGRVLGPVDGGIPIADLWGAPVPAASPRGGDEPMLITHTSSTTGVSKLVENSVSGVGFSTRLEAAAPFGHAPRELVASCISFVHVRAAITAAATLARGTSLLAIGNPEPETILRTFAKYRPTAVEAHPNDFVRWESIRDHETRPFKNVRIFFSTFDAAHPRTITRLLAASERTLPVWFQVYGQTEVQVISLRVYTRGSARRLLRKGRSRSLGWAPPGVRVRVADPQTQRRMPPGEPGMIQVRTPARSLAFLGTPEKYWGRRHGKWFDTGDWGRKSRFGDVEILDRVDDRIEGVESCLWLEDVLLDRIPEAEEIVVVPDQKGTPVPVVLMREGTRLEPSMWLAAIDGLRQLGEPLEVSETALKRTATAKARRYLLTEMIAARDAGSEDEAVEVRPEVLLREGS